MTIHNDTQRAAHNWQWETVNKLVKVFEAAAETDDPRLRAVFDEAYADLSRSVRADGAHLAAADEAYNDVRELILDGELNVQRVNSDVQLEPLLDPETAELKLRTKANFYIGGNILDWRAAHLPHDSPPSAVVTVTSYDVVSRPKPRYERLKLTRHADVSPYN